MLIATNASEDTRGPRGDNIMQPMSEIMARKDVPTRRILQNGSGSYLRRLLALSA